jgi:hypothetical protein
LDSLARSTVAYRSFSPPLPPSSTKFGFLSLLANCHFHRQPAFISVSNATNNTMDKPAHLSVIIDLSPTQWHLAAVDPNPLALDVFLPQLFAFLNAYIASMHENTLAVFAALPGKRFAVNVLVVVLSLIDCAFKVSCSILLQIRSPTVNMSPTLIIIRHLRS